MGAERAEPAAALGLMVYSNVEMDKKKNNRTEPMCRLWDFHSQVFTINMLKKRVTNNVKGI